MGKTKMVADLIQSFDSVKEKCFKEFRSTFDGMYHVSIMINPHPLNSD
jgi:hypothetical protein